MGGADKFIKMVNNKEESALHFVGLIKKSYHHYPGEEKKIVSLLMKNGADVFQQAKEVRMLHFVNTWVHGAWKSKTWKWKLLKRWDCLKKNWATWKLLAGINYKFNALFNIFQRF